jgi:N-acetyl-anhydromuramyl-L-alanine amidase AmpD
VQIVNMIKKLPWHEERRWPARDPGQINKIIIHQELAAGRLEEVNTYHISPGSDNHLSTRGCPHLCYHYGIRQFERDGEIVQANELSHITWHTKNYNTSGVGILLEGCFKGTGYDYGTDGPTTAQMEALENLVDYLIDALGLTHQDVYGHYHFGKPACPGYRISEWVETYRFGLESKTNSQLKPMDIRLIQRALKKTGYDCGKVDGIIGPQTVTALRNFQRDHNLDIDGIPGPQTQRSLQNL